MVLGLLVVLSAVAGGIYFKSKRNKTNYPKWWTKLQEDNAKQVPPPPAQPAKKAVADERLQKLMKELQSNPDQPIILEDPADIVAVLEQQQQLAQLQSAIDDMDKRATVPANYTMIH